MTVSRFRVMRSETRDLVDRDPVGGGLRFGEPTEWTMSNETFFKVFVSIAAVLAGLALILR